MTSNIATYKSFLVSVKFSRYLKYSLKNKQKLVSFWNARNSVDDFAFKMHDPSESFSVLLSLIHSL